MPTHPAINSRSGFRLPHHLLRAAVLSVATAAIWAVGATDSRADTLASVSIVERASGRVLPVYRHGGELWVVGRPGANYAVRVKNEEYNRILAVISVDGVNAISGKTASSRPKDGYVLGAADSYDVLGWRKSNDNIAAFYFSESNMSYAARTGRPMDVGVIGVALFREKVPEVVYEAPVYRSGAKDFKAMEESSAPVAADIAAPAPNAVSRRSSAEKRTPAATPSLGTGHGVVERSEVSTVEFESDTTRPVQIVRIRYDSYANLVAKGIIREPKPRPVAPRSPRAFPGDDGFVPDPPRN